MFEKVFASITTKLDKAVIGGTGYLDKMPWSGPVAGVDEHGRPFFALPLHTITSNYYIGESEPDITEGKGMVCFFKRYSDPRSDVWVTAESHVTGDYQCNPIKQGKIEDPSNGNVEEMVYRLLQGETVEFKWESLTEPNRWPRFYMKSRMLTQEELPQENT